MEYCQFSDMYCNSLKPNSSTTICNCFAKGDYGIETHVNKEEEDQDKRD
jgi:hypothetical protein